jgi:uncharacterized protein (TIGR02270 family)
MYDRLIEQHADEAAFLWAHRDFACRARHTTFVSLGELDERLEAHLDGLRLAGGAALALCRARLSSGDPGELFVAAVLAADGDDLRALAEVIDRAAGDQQLERAFVSALGWAQFPAIKRALGGLLSRNGPAQLRRLGVATCAAHRHDPGPMLADAAADPDPRLRSRALRAVGELGRADLIGAIRQELSSGDESCRYWASWSAALLGETGGAAALFGFATEPDEAGRRACDLALRRLPPGAAMERITELRKSPDRARLAVVGAAATGSLAAVPHLLEAMRDPALARLAGEAFAMITGIEITGDLVGLRPESVPPFPGDEPGDERAFMHPEELLPWPNPLVIERRYEASEKSFPRGSRLLCGQAIAAPWLHRILGHGGQPRRAAAALELVHQSIGQPLFEVRAPAFRQGDLLRASGSRSLD